MTDKTSFGEYFDKQHAAIVKAMQDKNKQLNVDWMKGTKKDKRKRKKMDTYKINFEVARETVQ